MRDNEWQKIVVELLDGVERELPSDTLDAIRERLRILRNRVINKKKSASRKNIEREVDAFLESTPLLSDCSGKYIVKILGPALSEAEAVLERAHALQKKYNQKNGA